MISDVPLGAFLSGGVDSSAVVATMARISAGPGQHLLDRLRRSRVRRDAPTRSMVAERYRTRHFVDRVESDDFDLIDTLAGVYDEPYADSSALPTYRVCQLARTHVTVALSGDGGDENFAGYRRYRLPSDGGAHARARCRSGCAARSSVCSGGSIRRPTGRRACSARRRPSKRSRATRSRPTSTASRSCATRCAAQLFSTAFRAELGGYSAVEVFHAARRARRHRRSARAGPVPRPEDLPRRRHQHQGRPREHGALAGGARAADGPPAGRVAGDACPSSLKVRGQRGQVPAQEGDGAVSARTSCCTGPRWVSRCRSRSGSAGRCAQRVRDGGARRTARRYRLLHRRAT